VGRKKAIKAPELSDALKQIIADYAVEVDMALAEATEEVINETLDTLKTSGKYQNRRGRYRNSFDYKKSGDVIKGGHWSMNDATVSNKFIIYSDGEYRLTHLLENGHLTRDGTTRTRPFPHWNTAQLQAEERFEALLLQKLEAIE
jgi:hypothetical protein